MLKATRLVLLVVCAAMLGGCATMCLEGDCENGQGRMRDLSGNVYEGSFRNGIPSGSGKYSLRGGIVYVGEMKNGLMEGEGQFQFPDGTTYVGGFKRGAMHGLGLLTGDRVSFLGGSVNGDAEGATAILSPTGTVLRRCLYKKGKILRDLGEAEFNQRFQQEHGMNFAAALAKTRFKAEQPALALQPATAGTAVAQKSAKPKTKAEQQRQQAEDKARKKAGQGQLASIEAERRKLGDEKAKVAALKLEQQKAEEEILRLSEMRKRLQEEKAGLGKAQPESAPTAQPITTPELKTALVVGNSTYSHMPRLQNPANDAKDMAATLNGMGFKVKLLVDADKRQMEDSIRSFGQDLRQGGLGLFYYAGHGMQLKGDNYLIPVNVDIQSEADIQYYGVNAGLVLAKMEEARNNPNIVILDACRNNPYARSSSRSAEGGLAKMDAPTGALIAYATSPGRTADDGKSKNGLYTKHLLANLAAKGVSVEDIFMRVRRGVAKDSGQKQIPWEVSSLTGNFCFAK